jgi:catechol 2,3-dioxygenase-like lactoylglutathione lyase family enzyme
MAAPAPASFALSRIGQIAIRVRNLERAITFYRDALGLPFLFQAPDLAFFQAGGVWLMLTTVVGEPEFDHPASILYFDVDDIEAAHHTLRARGVVFRTLPHAIHRAEGRELWLADFLDGEDNTFAIRSWRAA